MDFNEAKRQVGAAIHFYRALKNLDEILDTAQEAKNMVVRGEQELANMKNEAKSLDDKIAKLKPQLASLGAVYDEKMADMDAKVAARHDEVMGKLQKEIDGKKKELAKLEMSITDAADLHQSRMALYQDNEAKALQKAQDSEAKLAAAEKAYEEFKAKIK